MRYTANDEPGEPRGKRWCGYAEARELVTFEDSRALLSEAEKLRRRLGASLIDGRAMKTPEVFVEQVLIGFLVLLIGALPFVSAILPELDGNLKIIGSAIVATGVAYLLGIPFDRFADDVLSSLEKRNRLAFSVEPPVPGSEDPFPEDLLKIAVQQANDGTVRLTSS